MHVAKGGRAQSRGPQARPGFEPRGQLVGARRNTKDKGKGGWEIANITAALHARRAINALRTLCFTEVRAGTGPVHDYTNGGALTPALKSTTPNISIVRDADTM